MAKKKVTAKKAVKKTKTQMALRQIDLGRNMTFPVQSDDELAFIDTPPQDIMKAAKPNELKSKLTELKQRFIKETQELASEHDMNFMVRVYFTVIPKKE